MQNKDTGELWQLMKDGVVKFEADNEKDCIDELYRIQRDPTISRKGKYGEWTVAKMDDEEYREALEFGAQCEKEQRAGYYSDLV